MKSAARLTPRAVAPVVAIAATMALVTGSLLANLATPPRLEVRTQALESQTLAVQRQARSGRSGIRYPADAVCARGQGGKIDALKEAIAASARTRGLSVVSMSVGPDETAPLSQTLVTLRVRLQATGSYDQVMGLLGDMSTLRPMVFADALDLKSKTSSVALSISGRAFCVG